MTDILRPCVHSNGENYISARSRPTVCVVQMEMITFDARRRMTVYDTRGR